MKTIQLILQYLAGKASQDDREAMETWISASQGNKSLFEDIKSLDEQSNNLSNTSLIDTDAEWSKFLNKVNSSESAKVVDLHERGKVKNLSSNVFRRRFALAAAASVILILGAIFMFPDKYKEIHTGDTPMAITLDDGSQINLAANSFIKYPIKFDGKVREIFIDGIAKLDIFSDPSRPFTINSPITGVDVLGTVVDLEASKESSKLGVVEGKVTMFPAEDKNNAIVLNTGDVIAYTSAGFDTLMIGGVDFKNPPPPPEPEVVPEPEPEPEVVPEPEPEPEVIPEPEPEIEKPEYKRSEFLLHTFIDYLKKNHPEKDNFKTKGDLKYSKTDTVNVSVSAPLSIILKQMEERYAIEYSEDCDGCFEIISITPK